MGNYGVSDKLNFVWHPLCTNYACRNFAWFKWHAGSFFMGKMEPDRNEI